MATDSGAGQIHLRLGDDAKRVDRYIEHMKKTTKLEFTRADAVRSLLMQALEAFEAEAKGRKS